MKITTILSDLGNVVVKYDEMKACRALAKLSCQQGPIEGLGIEMTPEYIQELVFGPMSFHQLYQRGRINWQQVFDLLLVSCRIPFKKGIIHHNIGHFEEIENAYNDVFEPIPEVIALWKKCRALGLVLTALSDTEESRLWEMERKGYLGGFDHGVYSFEEGMTKPDGPEIFIRALDRSGCKAEEALFVDDRQVCIDEAAKLGIRTFTYDLNDHKALMKKLILLGVPLLSS